MVSTAVGLALTQLPSSFLDSIGWRMPFLIGGSVIIPIAYFSRKGIPETDSFKQIIAKNEIKTSPILLTLKNDYKPFLIIIFGTAALMTTFYGAIIYMTTYIVTVIGLSLEVGLIASLTSLAFWTFLTPVFGFLSDLLKTRKRLFLISTLLLIPLTPIYFLTLATHQLTLIVVIAAIFGVAASAAAGTLVAFVSESFPTSERATGFTSYNISAAYFGGFAPVIFITLIGLLNSNLAPAYYVMAVAIMSAAAVYFARDTGKIDELPQNESLYSAK
jgi:MHS family proline/betaine transporter-like MFS transporter